MGKFVFNDKNYSGEPNPINDSIISANTTWSSDKINNELAALPSYVDLTDILTAGNTTLTIQSPYITTAGTYDIYTDPEVPYNSKVVTAGQIVITFDAQSSDLAVKVRIT